MAETGAAVSVARARVPAICATLIVVSKALGKAGLQRPEAPDE